MNIDDLEAIVDEVEEAAFQIDIIKSFEERGWGLYECASRFPLMSLLELQPIVELGRERAWLKHEIKYIPLPLNEQDTNWVVIRDLCFKVMNLGRGPYYMDFDSRINNDDKEEIWPIARYFIDSIQLNPPHLLLHIDKTMSNVLDPAMCSKIGSSVEIHLSELNKIRRQFMMALR